MSTIERAIEIASRAHAGQVDKAGEPYIFHPLRLMQAVQTPEERIVAVLHDVVEDTDVTLEELKSDGFSDRVIEAIDALTRREGETRLEAARRAAENSLARVVKLADVTDNMDFRRIPIPSEKDLDRLREYVRVKELLERATEKR